MVNNGNLLDTIKELKAQGYTEDFNLQQQCIECRDGAYKIFHDEFEIDNYFRFDNASDPADQSIVYAISSPKYGLKGVLVNSYGIYSDPLADEMLEKLKVHS